METKSALEKLTKELNHLVVPLQENTEAFYEKVLTQIGDANFVLLGEATHGTKEFYQTRIEISKRLITEKNFQAITIEGDWTSAYPVQRFIVGDDTSENPEAALSEFKRFPAWMWANTTMPPFLDWLRNYNKNFPEENKIGFYGLDLYCLYDSMRAVIEYLYMHYPEGLLAAVKRYACFDHAAFDPQNYGFLVESGVRASCLKEVTAQFLAMQKLYQQKLNADHLQTDEELFYATQNALVVKNAEEYYRALFEARDVTWNLRDQHMATTLTNLKDYLEKKSAQPAKIIVWAHNSHVGDARATEMSDQYNELNLGQLVREKFSRCFLLGFSTYQGTVTAANEWGEEPETKILQPGIASSYEELFHHVKPNNFLLNLQDPQIAHYLSLSRLQRAVGVIYRPESERMSHYFFTHLPQQFDAIIHIDRTTAVEPLRVTVNT